MRDDLQQEPQERPAERHGPLFWIGAFGLVVAMGTDTIAVAGRHLGLPLRGSIELVQAAILLTASAAMLSATIRGNHAVVHLLTQRLSPGAREWAARGANLLSALFFAALAVGAAWLMIDVWNGHEESELLHIPFRPLRLVSLAAMIGIAAMFLIRTVRPGGSR